MIQGQQFHDERKSYPELKVLEGFTNLMDNRFRIPGTNFRFGLDPIIGLVPVAGEIASFFVSSMLVLTMARHGASGEILVRMIINITLDAILGSIPLLGNVFDFFIKANQRNLNLLKEHYYEGRHQGSGKGILAAVLIGLFAAFVLICYLAWKAGVWIWGMVQDYF